VAQHFVVQRYADNSVKNVIVTVSAVFRVPLRHVGVSAMIHQMNRLGAARRVDDPEAIAAGRPAAPLPRRGTDAGGA
jgi:hypothetical protein